MSLDYLKNTENNAIANSIVPLIENQFPEFIQNQGEQFVEFLKAYYSWFESAELTISNVVQNEFRLTLEDDDTNLSLETGDTLILESIRETSNTSSLSSFEKDEKITGQTSGAIGIVDRSLTSANNKIYVTGLERNKFIDGEIILGSNNRTTAEVESFFKNPLFASKSLLSQRDIDSVDDIVLNLLKKELGISIHEELSIDKRYFLKHIFDLYRSKGSEYSYDLFFKSFFNVQDLEFYRPKIDLLSPSSGDYRKENTLRIITADTNDKFESRKITGQTSSATAIVDRVENFVSGALEVSELFLTDIFGTFIVGETITSSLFDNTSGSGIAQGVLTDIVINSAGTNYKVGDSVTITGGGGQDAAARVSQIGTGAITGFTIFDGGDGYINTTALTVNNFATGGTGVSGDINEIAHTFTFSVNDDIIGNYTSTVINDADGYELSGNTEAIRTDRIIDALGFTPLQIGTISNVKATGLGSGYELTPIISVVQDQIAKFNDPAVGIINLNSDPDNIAETNAISGIFTTGERITSNNGNKVGTFLGLVSNANTISNPSRFRSRSIEYQGTFGSGRNDLTVNTANYVNNTEGSEIPAIYDIQLNAPTFTGDKENTNTFVFRRGINAASTTESTNTDTTIEYTASGTEITGGFQTLKFPITSITRSSTTATVTTPKKHGLDDGQKVILSGATQTEYNGEKTISVTGTSTFTYTVSGSPATPATGTPVYDENVAVKFTLPFGHKADDRFLVSTNDFVSNEVITGFSSEAVATVNTGVAIASGGIRGNNAVIGVGGLAAGSIKEIEIINFGVGYTTAPALSLEDKGGGNANISANIGAVGVTTGRYLNEDGRPSSIKKLIDSNFYQDYSYSLKSSKQLTDYEDTVHNLLHPAGSKLFGEFKPSPPSLQMGFDHVLTNEDDGRLTLEDGDSILMEQYLEPSHSISLNNFKTIDEGGTGGLITVTGNSNIITADVGLTDELTLEDGAGVIILENNDNFLLETATVSTDFPENFVEGSKIIIDDEQAFEISYGDLLLEKQLSGTLNCSSSNVLSYIELTNTSSSFIVGENFFQGETDTLLLDNDNGINSANIENYFFKLEDETNFLYESTDNNVPDKMILQSTLDPVAPETGDNLILESSDSTVIDTLFLENQNNTGFGVVSEYSINSLNTKIIALHSTVNTFSLTSNANGVTSGATANLASFNKHLIRGVNTNFEEELTVNDIITLSDNDVDKMQVMSIINSTAIICNTTIGDGTTVKFDNNIIHSFVLESTIRGTTSANGLNDGNTTIIGNSTFFTEDLQVSDVISLSSNTSLKAQVISIIDNTTLVVNSVLGSGSSNVTFISFVNKNLNLEPTEQTITLSGKYSGDNNFMSVTEINDGFLHLEDETGLLNVLYTTSNTSSGKLQFEETTTFQNVIPKLIV